MLYNLHFSPSKCRLFHNTTLFGFCITHILNTGVLKFEKKVRRQKVKNVWSCAPTPACFQVVNHDHLTSVGFAYEIV